MGDQQERGSSLPDTEPGPIGKVGAQLSWSSAGAVGKVVPRAPAMSRRAPRATTAARGR
jgi:hypothetical protein